VAVAAVLGVGLLAYQRAWRGPRAPAPAPPVAVGVLPFLDMTPTMDQEPLADDVTERLIDRLSENPALRIPSFRASFLLKGKHASIAQAARLLGVAYVVDGTSRREGGQVRISERLIRADTGFVVWSQSYERPTTQIPAVQGAAAAGISAALAHTAAVRP
jgi:TolB-like protein